MLAAALEARSGCASYYEEEEEAPVNKRLPIGSAVLGVLLVIAAVLDHYVMRIKMDHLASLIFGLGVALIVFGVGLLLVRRLVPA